MSFPPVNLIHVDDALIVADKPAGLLAVPGRGSEKQDCLSARLQCHYPDAMIVHRLDMDTSGLICFGRGAQNQRTLSMAFAARVVHKRYVAWVHGELRAPSDDWQLIDLPLSVDWPNRPRSKVDLATGKPSQTRWRRIAYDAANDITRVELEPVTGRSHQLRVHMLALEHPIFGDPLYGPATGTARMMLHAASLTLPHPQYAAAMCFAAPLPF